MPRQTLLAALMLSLLTIASLVVACGGNNASLKSTPAAAPSPAAPIVTQPAGSPIPASPSGTPAARKPSGTLVVQQPSLRNAAMIPELGTAGLNVYYNLMYEYLTTLGFDDASGQYTTLPGLATRWERTPDLKNWTFYLRQGVQWQDGNGEFTADDVKYAVDKVVKNPQYASFSGAATTFIRIVDSVEVLDPYKVTFHLASPYAGFDGLLSDLWNTPPLSKKYLDKVGVEEANKKPIGTGPYKFVNLKIGESLTLEALDQHWRHVPYYKTMIFKEVPEISTSVAMLKTGDADIIVAPITLKDEIVAAGFAARINPQTEYTYAIFNGLWDEKLYPKETDLKIPWRDVRVRQAMNLAIDRGEIIRSLYKSQAQAAPVILYMPGTVGYNPDLKPYPYDPAKAKKLLAEAGYPQGFEFNLPIFPWTHAPEIPDLGQVLAMYWSKIGLRANMNWSEFTTLSGKFAKRQDPHMVMPRGSTRMTAPEIHMETYFNPKGQAGINAPDIWELSHQLEAEGDLAKKDAIGRAIAQKIYDGYWLVPVAWSSMPYYASPKKVGDWPFIKGQPYSMRLEYLRQP